MYKDAMTRERKVTAGDVIVLFPGLQHSYHRVDLTEIWSECFIEFRGEIFVALERDGVISRSSPILSPGLQEALIAESDAIIRDYQSAGPGDEALFAARAHLLLIRCVDAHKHTAQSPNSRSFLTAACARLQEALDRDLEIPELARSFGMSDRAFRRRFAELAGMAPTHYRLLQRIAVGRALLTDTELPVGEVAEKLGYCDVQFFSRQFKQITGMTPSYFRRSPQPRKR